jgi:hypothetical protein
MPRCPLRSVGSWTGRSKPMTASTLLGTRDKPGKAGRNCEAAHHGGVARSANPAAATMTRIGQL